MRRRSPAVAALLGAAAIAAAAPAAEAQSAGPTLTSAPYDLSLFRDGETRRMHARFGGWTVVCDEIIRLHSRYCSLSVAVADASGDVIARLDVSTDEAGRPAALLHLPHGTLFGQPITLAPSRSGSPVRALRGTSCDAGGCAAVWALDAADFATLKRDGFALAYRRTTRLDRPAALLRPADIAVVTGRIPADGFADAVAASMKAGPLAEATVPDDLGLRH